MNKMNAFDVLAQRWFNLHGTAPFTSRTLLADAKHHPEIEQVLLALAPSCQGDGVSQNRLTRALRERELHTAATVFVLMPVEEGMWRFAQNDLVDQLVA
jgi:hypothetical protein